MSVGTLSCDKRSGCWKVLGSKGVTAGCVDMLIALLPGKCGITCQLEYQGYGVCEESASGVVCFSCVPSATVRLAADNRALFIAIVSWIYLMHFADKILIMG